MSPQREPSPEYQQRAMAMLRDELQRRGQKLEDIMFIPTEEERRRNTPRFILDADTDTMHIVPMEEETVSEPVNVDITSSDPVTVIDNSQYAEIDETSPDFFAINPNDPFEAAIIDIVTMNRRKRADYAYDGDPFSNFKETAKMMGGTWTAADSAHFNIAQKMARLAALRSNGRMNDPANESVTDTRLDLAVYAIIAYAIHRSGEDA